MLLLFSACENRPVKYDALNDLFVGIHQVVLYENGEFYLELGAGGLEGTYKIKDDTIHLTYEEEKPKNWPDKLLMTDDYFIVMNKDSLKIRR